MKKKKSPGRPSYWEPIYGQELKKNIKKEYKSQTILLNKCEWRFGEHLSRAWLSECIKENKMSFTNLDMICKVLNHSPEYYLVNEHCGKIILEPGSLPVIPPYEYHDKYLKALQHKDAYREVLQTSGIENEEDQNKFINNPANLISIYEDIKKVAERKLKYINSFTEETDSNGVTFTYVNSEPVAATSISVLGLSEEANNYLLSIGCQYLETLKTINLLLLFRANKPVGSEVALALVNNKEIPLDQLPTEIYKYLKKIKPELKEEPEEVRAATKYDIDNF